MSDHTTLRPVILILDGVPNRGNVEVLPLMGLTETIERDWFAFYTDLDPQTRIRINSAQVTAWRVAP